MCAYSSVLFKLQLEALAIIALHREFFGLVSHFQFLMDYMTYATSRKVAGSRLDEVKTFLHFT
jgi:hypothetical protein